jgi:hypothetical protein
LFLTKMHCCSITNCWWLLELWVGSGKQTGCVCVEINQHTLGKSHWAVSAKSLLLNYEKYDGNENGESRFFLSKFWVDITQQWLYCTRVRRQCRIIII